MCSIFRLGKLCCSKEEPTLDLLNSNLLRLAIIQGLIGVIEILLFFFYSAIYGQWYSGVMGLLGILAGIVGVIVTRLRTKLGYINFTILFFIKIVWWFFVTYLQFHSDGLQGLGITVILAIIRVTTGIFVAYLLYKILQLLNRQSDVADYERVHTEEI